MSGLWIDPSNGSIVDEVAGPDAEGSLFEGMVYLHDIPSPAENEWKPEFLARELARLEGVEAGVNAEFDKLIAGLQQQRKRQLRPIRAETNYLNSEYLADVKAAVLSDIEAQPGTKKSVDYKWGRFGERKQQPELVVEDEQKATDYLQAWHPEAVSVSIAKGALKTLLKTKPIMPGCKMQDRPDKFFFQA